MQKNYTWNCINQKYSIELKHKSGYNEKSKYKGAFVFFMRLFFVIF